ncbi:hypothetical protein TWF281_007016 [Arthrobotrys megalospora]
MAAAPRPRRSPKQPPRNSSWSSQPVSTSQYLVAYHSRKRWWRPNNPQGTSLDAIGLELESDDIFFFKDRSKSLKRSVSCGGTLIGALEGEGRGSETHRLSEGYSDDVSKRSFHSWAGNHSPSSNDSEEGSPDVGVKNSSAFQIGLEETPTPPEIVPPGSMFWGGNTDDETIAPEDLLAFTDGTDPGEHKLSTLRGLINFGKGLNTDDRPHSPIYVSGGYIPNEAARQKVHRWQRSSFADGGSMQMNIENDDIPGYGNTNMEKLEPGVEDGQAIGYKIPPYVARPSSSGSGVGPIPSSTEHQSIISIADPEIPRQASLLSDSGSSAMSIPSDTERRSVNSTAGTDPEIWRSHMLDSVALKSEAQHTTSDDDQDNGLLEPVTTIKSLQENYDTLYKMEIKCRETAVVFQREMKSFKRGITRVPLDFRIQSSEWDTSDPNIGLPLHLWEANSENWREIRDSLPPVYQFAVFSHEVWTLDTTCMTSRNIKDLPIRISRRPVILNYTTPVIGSFPYHPDPAENRPIDPRRCLDDDTLRLLFRIYPGAKAACVLLNRTLIILHDGKLNRREELRTRPRKFGGLNVDYIMSKQRYTSGSIKNASIFHGEGDQHPRPRPKTNVGSKVSITYDPGVNYQPEPNGHPQAPGTWTEGVRVGLSLRSKHKDENKRIDVVTTSLHTLLEGADKLYRTKPKIMGKDGPWANPAKFADNNKDNFRFSYLNREFGKLHGHFEPKLDRPHIDGEQRLLMHDIALIEARPKHSNNMPFLVFREADGTHIEMEWADPNEDFISQRIFLLGFEFESRNPARGLGLREETPTASESGSVPLHRADFENKVMGVRQNGFIGLVKKPTQPTDSEFYAAQSSDVSLLSPLLPVVEYECSSSVASTYDDKMDIDGSSQGNGYSRGTSATASIPAREYPVTVEGRMYAREQLDAHICESLDEYTRTVEYFQKAYLWRPDYRETGRDGQISDNLPPIGGASGCPLATKTEKDGKTVYKIFGFQSSEIDGPQAEDPRLPEKDREQGAVFGTFRTYQSLCLPNDLRDNWEIVWDPACPSSKGESNKNETTKSRRIRSRPTRVLKRSIETPHLFNLRQGRYNQALLQSDAVSRWRLGFRRRNARRP